MNDKKEHRKKKKIASDTISSLLTWIERRKAVMRKLMITI